MSRRKVTFADVLAHSGIHPVILDFAVFNGYSVGSSDLSLDEQADRLKKARPELDDEDILVLLGDDLRDDVNDWFKHAFPIVDGDGHNDS